MRVEAGGSAVAGHGRVSIEVGIARWDGLTSGGRVGKGRTEVKGRLGGGLTAGLQGAGDGAGRGVGQASRSKVVGLGGGVGGVSKLITTSTGAGHRAVGPIHGARGRI